jgi:hypothetical protein
MVQRQFAENKSKRTADKVKHNGFRHQHRAAFFNGHVHVEAVGAV